jgi:hypothetical protein
VWKSSGGNKGGEGILGEECLELDWPVLLKFVGGKGGGVGIFLGCCTDGFNWLGDMEPRCDLGSFAKGRLLGERAIGDCMGKLDGGCGLFGDNLGLVANDKFKLEFGSSTSLGCFLEK